MTGNITNAENAAVPEKPNDDEETHDLVNAIWREGWKKGHRKGYRMGLSNGASTLSRRWFFFTAMGFLVSGLFMGMFMQFLVTCGPDIPCGLAIPGDWGFAPVNVVQPHE